MLIRPAREDDLAVLAPAIAALPLYRPYPGVTAAGLEKRWRQALANHEGLWVAERDGAAVGLAWFSDRGAFGVGAYLRTIALVAGEDGKGTGALLLKAYEDNVSSPGGWFLLVSDFNTGAQRFYQRHGYREVGRLPDLVARGVTELIYWKR